MGSMGGCIKAHSGIFILFYFYKPDAQQLQGNDSQKYPSSTTSDVGQPRIYISLNRKILDQGHASLELGTISYDLKSILFL